jgi:hypothetical protein
MCAALCFDRLATACVSDSLYAPQGLQPSAAPALRGLQKVLSQLHDDLAGPCDDNLYTLQYLAAAKPQIAAPVE